MSVCLKTLNHIQESGLSFSAILCHTRLGRLSENLTNLQLIYLGEKVFVTYLIGLFGNRFKWEWHYVINFNWFVCVVVVFNIEFLKRFISESTQLSTHIPLSFLWKFAENVRHCLKCWINRFLLLSWKQVLSTNSA